MPPCGIIQCAAKKDNIHKDLTLHQFPTNDNLRQKWLTVIGEDNLRPACRNRPYICSLHFEKKYLNRSTQRTRLSPDAVPSLNLMPKNKTFDQIETIVNEAVKLAESSHKMSSAAPSCLNWVQPKTTSAPKGTICRECKEIHRTTLTPLVIVDIPPPAAPIETISPIVIEKEIPTFDTKRELRLRNRCWFLEKQLRAWKQKVRRKVAMIDKLEDEKKELYQQHLKVINRIKVVK